MNKLYLSLFICIFTFSLCSSQKLGAKNIFYLLDKKDNEIRTEFLLGKKFEQENSRTDIKLRFVKKEFKKRTQEMDEETLLAVSDTITYILNDPKKYLVLKKAFEFESRANPSKKTHNKTLYHARNYSIEIIEEEIPKSETTVYKKYIFLVFPR